MTITSKFKKDLQTLRDAANYEIILSVKNPKLLKKLTKYYKDQKVIFSGDPTDDYEMMMDLLYADNDLFPNDDLDEDFIPWKNKKGNCVNN